MDMGTAGFVKHPGKEDFIGTKGRSADRAFSLPGPASLQAVYAPFYVHEPAAAVPRIGKSRGFYEFSVFQQDAADRTTPGRSGAAFPGSIDPLFAETPSGRSPAFAAFFPVSIRPVDTEKQGKAKPEEYKPDEDKDK
jgi:hypothetical protein